MGKIKKEPLALCEGSFHNLDYKITLTFRSVPDRTIFGVIKTTGLIFLVMGYIPRFRSKVACPDLNCWLSSVPIRPNVSRRLQVGATDWFSSALIIFYRIPPIVARSAQGLVRTYNIVRVSIPCPQTGICTRLTLGGFASMFEKTRLIEPEYYCINQ